MRNYVYMLVIVFCLIILTALGLLFWPSQPQGEAGALSESAMADSAEENGPRSAGADASNRDGSSSHEKSTGISGTDCSAVGSATQNDATEKAGTTDRPHGEDTGQGHNQGTGPHPASRNPGTQGRMSDGSGGGVVDGTPVPSRELQTEKESTGAVFYEGRWVEGAIAQRRHELLLRRAYAEAVAFAQKTYGKSAILAPFDDQRTAVALMETTSSYLVSTVMTAGEKEMTITWEVVREKAGEWHVIATK